MLLRGYLQEQRFSMQVTFIECGNIGRAAEQLNMTVSALAQNIRDLEKDMNLKLLGSAGHLTDDGKWFYQQFLPLIRDMQRVNNECVARQHNNNVLELSGNHVPLLYLLPNIIKQLTSLFAHEYPQYSI
jgi:DNA-binding transcriptional LysR family regulator